MAGNRAQASTNHVVAGATSNLDPVFVVGTGRCGSALVSQMIQRHPQRASLSEVFSFTTDLGMRIERSFPRDPIDGVEFWKILADPQPRQNLLLDHGLVMPEVLYYPMPKNGPHALGPIQQTMLPELFGDDCDDALRVLSRTVGQRPEGPVGEHFRSFFDLIAWSQDKAGWVERSAGGLRFVDRLIELFPNASFIHLVRDGRDTAVSMSRHIGFRMALLCATVTELLGTDPFEDDDRSAVGNLPDDLAMLLPERFTAAGFGAAKLTPETCAHYWSGEILAGLKALSAVDQDRLLTIRYEDLISSPTATLTCMDAFLSGTADSAWVGEAATLVENRRRTFDELDPTERAQINEACWPGFQALEEHGLSWVSERSPVEV